MTESHRPQPVSITQLPTGVPGLDDVLGGGLPEYSFTLLAGASGTGKTTLAHQVLFSVATPQRPAVYFTLLGEPPIKLLRYQQQFTFFDPAKVDRSIRFVDLSEQVLEHDLGTLLQAIVREVEQINPKLVVVDSLHTLARTTMNARDGGELDFERFLQRLAIHLTMWQATTFLVAEYGATEQSDSPLFTVADGILWLYQTVSRNSTVRRLQVLKVRGQAGLPGLHTMRITQSGVHVFPRLIRSAGEADKSRPTQRLSLGVAGLDEMLRGRRSGLGLHSRGRPRRYG